jgi:hypothetical protein
VPPASGTLYVFRMLCHVLSADQMLPLTMLLLCAESGTERGSAPTQQEQSDPQQQKSQTSSPQQGQRQTGAVNPEPGNEVGLRWPHWCFPQPLI